jgi:POT family proton-dependent oligopeptide transporter
MNSVQQTGKTVFGHPVGLLYLSFTEAWERFSYYGMQTLLVLYLTKQLLLGPHIGRVIGFKPFEGALEGVYGHLTTVALASAVFGFYTSMVYVTPIFGGFLADRVLGRTRTVTLGAILMAIGHFLMAFDASFLFALACLLIGVGCFKGNIATQVGELYAPDDKRRADAFQVYMFGIQVAVIISPLVCGGLGQMWGWHWGFGAAGVGMLIGLGIYLAGRKHLAPEPPVGRKRNAAPRPPLQAGDKRTIAILVILLPVLALASVGNQQMGDAYMVWGDQNLQLKMLGFDMPVTWLVSVDSFVSAVTMAGSVVFWRWWATRRREPDEITKLTIGTAIAALAPAFLAIAALHPAGQRAPLGWALLFHLVNDIGFANVFPVGLALYSRAAPRGFSGTMVSVYYLNLALCNWLVGWLGGLLDKMPGASFWMLHAGLIGVAALLLLVARTAAGRVLAPTPEVAPVAA